VTWAYYREIFGFLYVPADGTLSPYGLPVFTNPTETMDAVFSLALKGGAVVAAPVVVFGIYRLARPHLGKGQRRFLTVFLPVMGLFYLGGAAFAYYVMLPIGLRFLLNFGTDIAVPMITISAYMSLVTALVFWLGVIFEIPLVMFLLAKLRLVRREMFAKLRMYVPIAALFLGMIITPTTDPLNQLLVAGPIVALYEVGLALAWLAEGGHKTLARKAGAAAVRIWRRFLNALGRLRVWAGRVARKVREAIAKVVGLT
jgi:sec-independent protein translocase protein TatC